MKRAALLLFLFLLTIPAAQGFTWDGDFNYQPPGGGVIHFANDFSSNTHSVVNTRYTWGGLAYQGRSVGVVGLDTTCNITVQVMTEEVLQYTTVAAGSQIIYYRGLYEPTELTGGTSTRVGNVLTVSTPGASTVRIYWGSEVLRDINSDLLKLLGFAAIVFLLMGAALVRGALGGGEINFVQFIGVMLGVFVAFLVAALFLRFV